MDRLQPVIKQIFWIFFSIAVILLLAGWWSAKGTLAEAIETRNSAVKQAFTDGKQNVSTVPNSRWTDGATEINDDNDKKYQLSAVQLYQRQLTSRTYPRPIANELSRIPFNSTIAKKALRQRYRVVFDDYLREQLSVIRPFYDGKGIVDVDSAEFVHEVSFRRRQRPLSSEIWQAQEDVWLLKSICDSIASVNKGFDQINKAPLRAIHLLQLRGGDREAAGASSGGAAAAFGGGDDMYEGFSEGYGGGGEGAVGAGNSATGVWSPFEGSLSSDLLTEELGAPPGAAMAMGGDYEGSGGFGGPAPSSGDSEDGGWEDRYVDSGDDLPYRTRAFALTVRIVQTHIPHLLGALTNSDFPIEILRVDASFDAAGGGPMASSSGYGGSGEDMGYEDDYESGAGFGGGGFGGGFGSGGFGGGGFGGGYPGAGGMAGGGYGQAGGGSTGTSTAAILTASRLGSRPTKQQIKEVDQGNRFRESGLSDVNLCTLRVAGLMTLYRSQQENDAEAESEAAAATEAQEEGAEQMPLPEETQQPAGGQPAANGEGPQATGEPGTPGGSPGDATQAGNGTPPDNVAPVTDPGQQPAELGAPAQPGPDSSPTPGVDGSGPDTGSAAATPN